MDSTELRFSVVLSTYNRGALLVGAVRSLLALDQASPPHELIIVDNNSRDHTREVVQSMIPESGGRLRYVFEGRQGIPSARNAGVVASRGQILVFTDDDVRAQADLLIAYDQAFAAYPDVTWMGGKVLPMWPAPPPAWLTAAHSAPLALIDFGGEGFTITQHAFRCMVGANLAVRREAFDVVGVFDPAFQNERGAVTACEDHEFENRLVNAGLVGRYEPTAVIHAEVQPNRLTQRYHRKWHRDHGRAAVALLAPSETFDARGQAAPMRHPRRQLFGAPFWAYRAVAENTVRAVYAQLRGRSDDAFSRRCEADEARGHIVGCLDRWRASRSRHAAGRSAVVATEA